MPLRTRAIALCALLISTGCGSPTADEPGDGPRLYITSGATDEVLVLDAADGSVLSQISMDVRRDEADEPHGIEVAPDGRHWYATVAHGAATLWKFELPGNRLVGRVELGTFGASRVGITPGGDRAFVPDYWRSGQGQESNLAVVELEDLNVVARPTVCAAPHDAQVSPDGDLVAIACSLSDDVVVLDARSLEEQARFYVDDAPGPPGSPAFKPLNLVWSPNGDRIYVSLFAAGALRAFDPAGASLGTADVGAGPAQVAITPDGSTVVTANRNDASISLVSLPEMLERDRIDLARMHPHGVDLDTDGTTAFVTYEGTTTEQGGVVAVDLATSRVVWSVRAGSFTLGIIYVNSE